MSNARTTLAQISPVNAQFLDASQVVAQAYQAVRDAGFAAALAGDAKLAKKLGMVLADIGNASRRMSKIAASAK